MNYQELFEKRKDAKNNTNKTTDENISIDIENEENQESKNAKKILKKRFLVKPPLFKQKPIINKGKYSYISNTKAMSTK